VFEAVKQCGRSVIPAIEPPASFDEVIARPERRIVFDLNGAPASAGEQAPAEAGPFGAPLILLIGPEGGWTDEELEAAKTAGCAFSRLGTRRLRAETAAIAALTAAGLLFGDLSG
jgi:16S rRNA (uracil1498-N3)-methyltransferase